MITAATPRLVPRNGKRCVSRDSQLVFAGTGLTAPVAVAAVPDMVSLGRMTMFAPVSCFRLT
jgi:hypothetical protein